MQTTPGYVDIIYGLFWGDEGKGKIIDVLAHDYQMVIRANGGSNAGHTIYVNGKQTILHLLPSAVEHKHVQLVCATGMALHPTELLAEVEQVAFWDPTIRQRLFISDRATITTPIHVLRDQLREKGSGAAVMGSTKKGISFAYADDACHIALRYSDIRDLTEEQFTLRYRTYADRELRTITALYPDWANTHNISELEASWMDSIRTVRETIQIVDTIVLANEALRNGNNILIEGAQATLLDTRIGCYPYVTSSHTIPQMLLGYAGLPIHAVRDVIAVTKWYITKVGGGDFPPIMDNTTLQQFQTVGHEYGATTKRPRMCGWPDLVMLRHALLATHPTKLFLNKCDVCPTDTVQVVTHYVVDGVPTGAVPTDISRVCGVVTESMPGWQGMEMGATVLPENLAAFVRRMEISIQEYLPNTSIVAIGTGPGRDDMVFVGNGGW